MIHQKTRVHIDTLEETPRPSQKYVLISYLVPNVNMEKDCRAGFIVRGCYPDEESALAAFRKSDLKLNAVIAECGKPLYSTPTVKEMEQESLEVIYSHPELNQIMSSMNRRNKETVDEFENHYKESKERDFENDPEYIKECLKNAEERYSDLGKHIEDLNDQLRRQKA